MKTLPREAAEELLDQYWNELKTEWFKPEVLQVYSAEDAGPSLESWLTGDKQRSIGLLQQEEHLEWVADRRKLRDKGVELIRLHIGEELYSPYIQWELMHYEYINVRQCGEKVYLVNNGDALGLKLPAGDLMIFDNMRAVVNAHGPSGLMPSRTFYDQT